MYFIQKNSQSENRKYYRALMICNERRCQESFTDLLKLETQNIRPGKSMAPILKQKKLIGYLNLHLSIKSKEINCKSLSLT